MTELNEVSFSAINYLKIFFRRKELMIMAAFAGLILGISLSIILPKKYLSSTVLLVEEGKTDNPLFNNIAVSTTVEQRMSTIQESMLGWNNLVQLVKRLSMDKDVKTVPQFEQLILKIRKDIIFRMRNRNVIELAYVGVDPVQTQQVVKTLTDIFIERNVEVQNKETSDAISFIEDQLKVYQGKIKSAEIARLEDQLNAFLVDSTEEHPMVKQLREQITKKKEDLKAQNLEYTKSDMLKTEVSNPIINEIKKAIDSIETKPEGQVGATAAQGPDQGIYKVMLIDKLDAAMEKDKVSARDVAVNENIYNMLLQRIETAKITQRLQSSKEGTRYTILDPARVPTHPFEPNKPLVIFIGLFLGCAVGIGLVVAGEFLDKSFIDVEEAKEFLGVPLFGAISKITTEESLQQGHEKIVWMYSLTFLGGIIIVIFTTAVASFLK